MTRPKVFQIGFNRCGTRAIARLFRESGYKAAHWGKGRLARDLELARLNDRVPFADWQNYDFFSDIEWIDYENGSLVEGYRHYAFLSEKFPDALFLLNHRDRIDWLYSRMRHRSGRYVRFYAEHYGTPDPRAVLEQWVGDWEQHIAGVRRFFASAPNRLIDFKIDADPIEKLTDALAPHFRLDPSLYRVVGGVEVEVDDVRRNTA